MRFPRLRNPENPIGIDIRAAGKGSNSKAFAHPGTPGHSLGVQGESMVLAAPLRPHSAERLHEVADGDRLRGCGGGASPGRDGAVYPLGV